MLPGWCWHRFGIGTGSSLSCGELCQQLPPWQVADRFIPIDEVPRTLNRKKCEVPVKRILTGTLPTGPSGAMPCGTPKPSHHSSGSLPEASHKDDRGHSIMAGVSGSYRPATILALSARIEALVALCRTRTSCWRLTGKECMPGPPIATASGRVSGSPGGPGQRRGRVWMPWGVIAIVVAVTLSSLA